GRAGVGVDDGQADVEVAGRLVHLLLRGRAGGEEHEGQGQGTHRAHLSSALSRRRGPWYAADMRLACVLLAAWSGVAAADECPGARRVTFGELHGDLYTPGPTAKRKPPYPIIVYNGGSGPLSNQRAYFSPRASVVLSPP